MTDSMNLTKIIQEVQPDEIYNLAAMSHVAVSFETPEYVANADGVGTLLNCMVKYKRPHRVRPHHFIQEVLMEWQRCMLIGLR